MGGVGEGYGTGGGMLLGGQALEISVVCFSSFQGWEGFRVGVGVGVWVGVGGGGWVGVWGLGNEPATAGSLLVSHGQKKQPWTLPGYLSGSTPVITQKKQELRNVCVCAGGGTD